MIDLPESFRVDVGDCLDWLRALPDASVDAIVTDPPAGIAFMGKEWDTDRGGRDAWIAWLAERMRGCLRVLKPGGHALVWALPRTSHWTATAIEDAGFEIRDVGVHLFGQGFPKSHNLGDGRGTALKPAAEHWILARKPFRGTVAANVAAHGTGAINVDACRIGTDEDTARPSGVNVGVFGADDRRGMIRGGSTLGRWPANVALSHAEECREVGTRKIKAAPSWNDNRGPSSFTGAETSPVHHADADGTETVPAWECADGCPVAMLDEQSGERKSGGVAGVAYVTDAKPTDGWGNVGVGGSGVLYADTGGASRFFYCAKATKRDREEGLVAADGQRANKHPTVKPTALMRWLCRLVTPPGGLILDPFTGSGSTGKAAVREGFRFLGCEMSDEYAEIARARIAHAAE